MERVNVKGDQSIASILLYLNGGNNEVHFDDTFAIMVRDVAFVLKTDLLECILLTAFTFICYFSFYCKDVFGGPNNGEFFAFKVTCTSTVHYQNVYLFCCLRCVYRHI